MQQLQLQASFAEPGLAMKNLLNLVEKVLTNLAQVVLAHKLEHCLGRRSGTGHTSGLGRTARLGRTPGLARKPEMAPERKSEAMALERNVEVMALGLAPASALALGQAHTQEQVLGLQAQGQALPQQSAETPALNLLRQVKVMA